MDKVFLEPGRSNSSGSEEGHWKIMFKENGKVRHLNDGTSRHDAMIKAEKAAQKRGVALDSQGGAPVRTDADYEPPPKPKKKDFMDVTPPRGAPKKGTVVQFLAPDGSRYEGEVVSYLSEQFVIEYMAPTQRVVHMNEDWKAL